VAPFVGSNCNSASRLHAGGAHVVLASAGLGSVEVVDIATGRRCSQFAGIGSQHQVRLILHLNCLDNPDSCSGSQRHSQSSCMSYSVVTVA